MKNYIEKLLKKYSEKILQKYKPQVIGITGSIGKTSTRDACLAVLGDSFEVRGSVKNYNNEIGVPLTIIGVHESPGKSIFGWISVLFKAWKLVHFTDKKYPRVLVLEMGADKPGDIKYLIGMAPLDIGILTNIGPSHLENFGTIEKLIREKKLIATKLQKDKTAIINIDNEYVNSVVPSIKANVLSYGFSEAADVRAIELEQSGHGMDVDGLRFKIVYEGSAVPVYLPGVVGHNAIMASLAAAATAISLGVNLVDIAQRLKNYISPLGRMRLIPGIKHTLLIDDTYNASPESAQKALEVLSKFEKIDNARRIAVLGNMLELGSFTQEGHELVGKACVDAGVDMIITVGELGQIISESAKKAGMSSDVIFNFDYSPEAGRFLQDRMQQGDIILVKGSQGVRMEKIVKEVMAEPEYAESMLVRQGKGWD